jgi:hypothetical protein
MKAKPAIILRTDLLNAYAQLIGYRYTLRLRYIYTLNPRTQIACATTFGYSLAFQV